MRYGKKAKLKPIFPLKHDFYASLDHLLHQTMMLYQAVEQAIDLGAIGNESVKKMLAERVANVRAAMSEDP